MQWNTISCQIICKPLTKPRLSIVWKIKWLFTLNRISLKFISFHFLVFYIMLADIEGGKEKWLFFSGAYIFMRFSECLNPIFYNLASRFVLFYILIGILKCHSNVVEYYFFYLISSEFMQIFHFFNPASNIISNTQVCLQKGE